MPIRVTTSPIEQRAGLYGRHIVTCGTPAVKWREALVTGNGTLLFSTMGEPACDHLTLSREELESPQWAEPPQAPLIANRLDEVRKLILEGKYVEAAKLSSRAAVESGTPDTLVSNPRHPAITMTLTQPVGEAKDYLSILDLRTSLITTLWGDAEGVFKREMFTSRADGIAALRVAAPSGHLNLTLKREFPQPEIPKDRLVI
ncbi:MAG: glycoside hydrolase N-terminal domain-containing protein [Anaerolineae bacterium]|nr:glycoside hydrolase N-terminal domain-containing protein [Anaerolineae bacterium]